MLTVKVITPKQGESYYAKENYYSAEESVENSRWMGKGATKLGLKGKVKPKQFKKLLYGQLPNGTNFRRRKQERKGYKERAGLDCTFSAPKSVSILALVEGRKELEKAHRQAVLDTLKIIERNYATTRVSKDGKVTTINTDNMVVGQFHHDTSRELDPHLHTHCVILNMTEHNDKWYSFRNDEIFANKKLLGTIYQNQLAIRVKKLGIEIEQKGHGQFEIKGFTQEQFISFSKRRQQIKSQLNEESTWFEREKIWDKTRAKKKESIPREELQDYWRSEYEAQNVSYPQPSKSVLKDNASHIGGKVSDVREINTDTPYPKVYPLGHPNLNNHSPKVNINQAVAEAIEHCSERTVAFKAEDIQKFILTEVGNYSYKEIEKAIATSDELIHLDKQITTQSALLREIATIKLVKDGQDKLKALTNTEIVDEFIEKKGLTEGQTNAITLAATTGDQFIAWQGKAGVGKTYALNEFKQIAERQGYVVKGFAPSAKAAKVLAEEMSIETTTVVRKLVSKPLEEENEQQQIWIVDEAGLLGAKDAEELLKKAQAENARVLLVGDTRQLSSVAAGNPFKSLQNAGIATVHLNQSLRQKTKDLKHAVDLLSDGKIAEGIDILETNKRILEIQDSAERANHIAFDYLNLSPDERKDTLIIAGTHQEREAIISSIRQGLKEEGSLGEEVKAKRLKSKNLTNVQKKYAHYYEPGNIVIPLSNYKRLGLEKGQQYRVKEVDGDSLVLLAKNGQERRVSPTWFKHKEVYEAIETKIAVGDRLRWGKNDKQLNRINGGEFVVTQIDKGIATIQTETGKREKIDIKTPQYLDHALVSTTYSSQGVTSKKVYVSVTNDLTLSIESFYVAASRAKYNLQLYVEDKAKLVENTKTSRAQQNPLELIRAHRQKESAVSTTHEALTKKQQNLNQTVQENHERNQTPKPNPQRDSSRSSSPNLPTPRRDRNPPRQPNRESGIDPTGIEKAADGINSFIEEQEAERITESIESLNRSIRNGIESNRGIGRLARAIRDYTSYQERGRGVGAIRDSLEESILESDPNLIKLLDKEPKGKSPTSKQKRRAKHRSYLSKQLSNIQAYTQLSQGQSVVKDGRVQQDFRELANRARNIPLEEVVQRLGLEPDRYDPNKYKSDGHIISITDQRFYDHLNQKGGGGAIDLVMHVQDSSLIKAVDWLNGNSTNLTPIKQALSFSKQPLEQQPFEPPVPDESKWAAVRDYLVTTRGLPESMVDTLHSEGKVYADFKQNAVFVRKNMEGEVTGASLRGTYNDSKFKGLAKGTSRDAGWFALKKGQGELERIVLTESPIDAISAAAISQKKESTLFLSTDGAGALPRQFLQQKLAEGKQVIVAYDNDEAGQTMAQQVLAQLPSAQRITPNVGKDWNEQLLHSQNSLEQKKQVLRREYEGLRDRVRSNPNFRNSEVEEVDIAVAMLVIKEAHNNGQTDNLINRVGEVLSQSDLLKEWKQSMPEDEYRAKTQDYVVQTFEQASQIRENIRAERERNQDIEFER